LRNKEFFELLRNGEETYQKWEWITTVIFYSALHYVKATLFYVFNYRDNQINSHDKIRERLAELRRRQKLTRQFCDDYEALFSVGRIARYEYYEAFRQWDAERYIQQVEQDYVPTLSRIEVTVKGLLQARQQSVTGNPP